MPSRRMEGAPRGEWHMPPVTVVVPVNGEVVIVPASVRFLYVKAESSLDALTIQLPPAPDNCVFVEIGFAVMVKSLTIMDNNGVVVPGADTDGVTGEATDMWFLPGTPGSWIKWR